MNAPAFDLSQFEASDTARLEAQTPNGEPLLVNGQPVVFVLYGPGSAQYVRAQAKLDAANTTRTFAAMRGKPAKSDSDDQRRQLADKLAACTAAVENFPIAPLDIYLNPKLGYLTNQVSRFVEDWANFSPASATS